MRISPQRNIKNVLADGYVNATVGRWRRSAARCCRRIRPHFPVPGPSRQTPWLTLSPTVQGPCCWTAPAERRLGSATDSPSAAGTAMVRPLHQSMILESANQLAKGITRQQEDRAGCRPKLISCGSSRSSRRRRGSGALSVPPPGSRSARSGTVRDLRVRRGPSLRIGRHHRLARLEPPEPLFVQRQDLLRGVD